MNQLSEPTSLSNTILTIRNAVSIPKPDDFNFQVFTVTLTFTVTTITSIELHNTGVRNKWILPPNLHKKKSRRGRQMLRVFNPPENDEH